MLLPKPWPEVSDTFSATDPRSSKSDLESGVARPDMDRGVLFQPLDPSGVLQPKLDAGLTGALSTADTPGIGRRALWPPEAGLSGRRGVRAE
jgi:hypothetical protein